MSKVKVSDSCKLTTIRSFLNLVEEDMKTDSKKKDKLEYKRALLRRELLNRIFNLIR